MAKFFGELGYGHAVETPAGSGVYIDQITERSYYGDVVRNSRRLEAPQKVNFDIQLSNSIRIVADDYADQNIEAIRYVRWNGSLWIVNYVEVQRPRLVLELGGVYNGPTP